MTKVEEAKYYFREAHDSIGHKRKYNGDPYWIHTESVCRYLSLHHHLDYDLLIAALGHDCIEDVFPKNPLYSLDAIRHKFGNRVYELIDELTDVYTKDSYPDLNYETRKRLEGDRLKTMSEDAKLIKCADFLDNLISIESHDEKFLKTFLRQIIYVLPYLQTYSPDWWKHLTYRLLKTEVNRILKRMGTLNDPRINKRHLDRRKSSRDFRNRQDKLIEDSLSSSRYIETNRVCTEQWVINNDSRYELKSLRRPINEEDDE